MKMETLISCMLLIVSVWTRLHILVVDGEDDIYSYIWHDCSTSEYRNGSDFQLNLNQVLESLVQNASTSGFNTAKVEGQNRNSTVYGFFQCRGDLNSTNCKQCASQANVALLQRCHMSTSGLVDLNGCFLRYDYYYFYNDSIENPRIICNNVVGANPAQFANTTVEVLSRLIEKAVNNPKHFATDKNDTGIADLPDIYSLAQCWGNLSQTSCRSCLANGQSSIAGADIPCPAGIIGARYLSNHCFLRYEIRSFFNTSTFPSPQPPPPSGRKRSKGLGVILGVVAATMGLIAGISLWKWKFFYRRKPWDLNGGKGEINLWPSIANPELIFKYDILRDATSNFKEENKLGEGGFGSVFKGVLPDARTVAIKRLNIRSRQGDTEFLNEANLISRVQHKNLVKLIGCSIKNIERLLVYEYLENSSLDKILFDVTKRHLLDWRHRYEIIVGTARGLAYLHEESEIRIIHRDIKASNILLDNKYRPKIADFGLAKLFGEDQSHVSTKIAGTLGYIAPEYALRGQLTEKADVFGFGVLLLEIMSGRKNQSLPEHMEFLIEATWSLYNAQRALEVIDPTLEGSYSMEDGNRVIRIGLLCTQAAASLRPTMSEVVSMLTSEREYLSSPTRPALIDLDSVAAAHRLQRTSPAADPASGTLQPS